MISSWQQRQRKDLAVYKQVKRVKLKRMGRRLFVLFEDILHHTSPGKEYKHAIIQTKDPLVVTGKPQSHRTFFGNA